MILGFFGLAALSIGIGLTIIVLGLQLFALIDIIRSDFRNSNDKLIWILIVLFLNFFGAVLYFAIGTNQKLKHY